MAGYQEIKMDKSLYQREGGFSRALEELDPSDGYRDTELEGLTAFERQLKRFDIKVSGSRSDRVEKFFRTGDSAVLFPAYIGAAVEQGIVAVPWAFLLKLLFTAITLAAGFKGGEVVPSFFVGATFGCAVAPLLGLPAGFGAAVGLAAVFCGVTNCPLASTLLAVELFGAEGLLYFALACCLSYMLSGYQGLYSRQTILYSKLKAQFINVHTNAHHAGELPTEEAQAK